MPYSTRIGVKTYYVIPGAGHACCLEDPATFDEMVLSFLRKHNFIRG